LVTPPSIPESLSAPTTDRVNDERGIKKAGWQAYRQSQLASYPQKDAETNFQHVALQGSIALETALIAAAEEEGDSQPMEGFDPAGVDEILGLRARGLRSVVMLPLGYRAAEGDWLMDLNKARNPIDVFVTRVQ
jgi:nitroreductase